MAPEQLTAKTHRLWIRASGQASAWLDTAFQPLSGRALGWKPLCLDSVSGPGSIPQAQPHGGLSSLQVEELVLKKAVDLRRIPILTALGYMEGVATEWMATLCVSVCVCLVCVLIPICECVYA